jgi:hypothetical protein
MLGRQGLIDDREGALHMIEAVIGALLMLSCVTCLSAMPHGYLQESDCDDDLRTLSADLLYILEYRDNRPGHPGLAQALSMPAVWDERSAAIESDMRSLLPPGIRACLVTPYGDAGDFPPDGAVMYIRPFLVFRLDTHEGIDCKLILWRG